MPFGGFEVLLLLFVVFLVIGPRRVVDLARSLGRGLQDFTHEFGGDEGKDELRPGEDHEEGPRKKH